MEFLKEILGEELFNQFMEKVNAHNGNEANKDNQIKLGNLGTGEYVSKLKYDDIVQQLSGKQTEIDTANGLIAELKKATKGDEALQGKVTSYETQVKQLQEELKKTQLESAVKVALLGAKVTDIDYMAFRLNEKGDLELDDQGNIKGIEDKIAGLKTQYPKFFEDVKKEEIEPNPLPKPEDRETEPQSLADAIKANYEQAK